MTERWDRVTALFAAARALDPALRAQFLDLACEHDRDLRTEIDALLASDQEDTFLTETPWTLIGDAIGRSIETARRGERVPEPVPLGPGTRLGPYEIQKAIGAGGMGAVYRARDAKLNREVALKLLPDEFLRDPDRLARFQREAWLLASLNHPNIAQIYGFEQSDGRPFLVLELVAGESLADRLARGAMPCAEAVAIALQIIDALDAAHEQGIIHRDLKPANVKLRDDGLVKVLDFGLAKTVKPVSASSAGTINSPTPSARATEGGLILGTAGYMAPEQAKGKPTDRRADVWAFGVVLFEMLTGQPVFAGESASEVMASVIRDEPEWTRLPADLPAAIRRLLRRCLEKDPKKRLSAIADARLELTESSEAVEVLAPRRQTAVFGWKVGAVLAAIAVAVIGWLLIAPAFRQGAAIQPARVSLLAPAGVKLLLDASESAISPDGRFLALTTIDPDGNSRLWVRALDQLDARPLPGTERGFLPFWSPDSREIAFFADEKLMKLSVGGGTATVICAAKAGRGGTWSADGTIVFAPSNAGPLLRVSATGGEPHAVTTLDASRGETGHRFPWFLPDGRHFLYAALPPHNQKFDLYLGSLDAATREAVTTADGAAVYAAPGYLLFARQNALIAQRFDAHQLKLQDEPIVIGEAPAGLGAFYSASRALSVSNDGALVYLRDRLPNTRLEWLDRSGRAAGAIAMPEGRYKEFAFAPDGRHVSVVRYASVTESDIWTVDLDRGGATRFTYGPAINISSAWSPDGTRIVFDSDRRGPRDLFVKAAAGATSEEAMFTSPSLFKYSRSWTPDGKWIVFDQLDPETNRDLWILPVGDDHTPKAYLRTPFTEGWGQVSPDGRWMAYVSDESGRQEIYVDSFPTPHNKFRVSNDGALNVMWRRDGKELAILSIDSRSILVADVFAGADFRVGTPRLLVSLPQGTIYASPTPDFQRVLVARPSEENSTSSLALVYGWATALRKH